MKCCLVLHYTRGPIESAQLGHGPKDMRNDAPVRPERTIFFRQMLSDECGELARCLTTAFCTTPNVAIIELQFMSAPNKVANDYQMLTSVISPSMRICVIVNSDYRESVSTYALQRMGLLSGKILSASDRLSQSCPQLTKTFRIACCLLSISSSLSRRFAHS